LFRKIFKSIIFGPTLELLILHWINMKKS